LRRPTGCTAPRTPALSTHGRGQRTDSGCNRQGQDTVHGVAPPPVLRSHRNLARRIISTGRSARTRCGPAGRVCPELWMLVFSPMCAFFCPYGPRARAVGPAAYALSSACWCSRHVPRTGGKHARASSRKTSTLPPICDAAADICAPACAASRARATQTLAPGAMHLALVVVAALVALIVAHHVAAVVLLPTTGRDAPVRGAHAMGAHAGRELSPSFLNPAAGSAPWAAQTRVFSCLPRHRGSAARRGATLTDIATSTILAARLPARASRPSAQQHPR